MINQFLEECGYEKEDIKNYVVIEDDEKGGVFCLGITESFEEAFGIAMNSVFDFQQNYNGKDDCFSNSLPYLMEGEAGICIDVECKAACWDESLKHYYYILFNFK